MPLCPGRDRMVKMRVITTTLALALSGCTRLGFRVPQVVARDTGEDLPGLPRPDGALDRAVTQADQSPPPPPGDGAADRGAADHGLTADQGLPDTDPGACAEGPVVFTYPGTNGAFAFCCQP